MLFFNTPPNYNVMIYMKNKFLILLFFLSIVIVLTSCLTPRGVMELGTNISPQNGESVIIINGPAAHNWFPHSGSDITIYINGQIKGFIRGEGRARFVLPNGQYTLMAEYCTNMLSYKGIGRGLPYDFSLNSEQIEFDVKAPFFLFRLVKIQMVKSTPLE